MTTALGFYRSSFRSFWLDEAFSVTVFKDVSWSTFWDYTVHVEANMSLYNLMLRIWPFFASDSQIRSMSTLFAALVIPTTYFATARLFNRRCAIVATALLASQPFLMEFAQEARGYTLVLLMAALSLLTMLRALESPSFGRNALWALVTALGFYAHFFFAYIFFLEMAFLAFNHAKRSTWLAAAASVAGVAPLGLFILAHPSRDAYSWMGPADILWVKSTYAVIIASNVLLALLVAAGGCVVVLDFVRRHLSRSTLLLIANTAALPVVMLLVARVAYPMTSVRYYLISLPAIVTIAALAITRIRWVWLQAAMTIAAVTTSLVLSVSHHDEQAPWKVDMQTAATYLDGVVAPGELVQVNAPDVQVYDYYRAHGREGLTFFHLPHAVNTGGACSSEWIFSRGEVVHPDGYRHITTKEFSGGLMLNHWELVKWPRPGADMGVLQQAVRRGNCSDIPYGAYVMPSSWAR